MKTCYLSNGQPYVVRKASKDDAEKMLNYLEKIAGESDNLTFGPGELDITLKKETEMLDLYSRSESHFFMVAEYDNCIIGNINFTTHNRKRLHHTGEFGVSIAKDYWRNGIGKVLIRELIQWAKDGGLVTKINLRVRDDNTAAIALYEKLGFIKEGHISREFLIDGQYYSTYCMGLEL